MPAFRFLARIAALLLGLTAVSLAAQTVTHVRNTATLSFAGGEAGQPREVVMSNTVTLDVVHAKIPSTLSFRLVPVGLPLTGLDCVSTPELTGVGAPIDAATLATAAPLAVLDPRQALIMVLQDPTSNLDPSRRDVATIDAFVAGKQHEKLRLTETGPDTGIFAGGFPANGQADFASPCDLHLRRGDTLSLSISEDDDSLASSMSALVDPAGYVFDSVTGALVDGASVTLLDESGAPAIVFGDDGVTRYPSTVVSGADVMDASGRTYPGAAGHYRFPLTAPGHYAFRVVPPGGYIAPSSAEPDALARLRDPEDDQPYVVNDGS